MGSALQSEAALRRPDEYDSPYDADDRPALKFVEDTDPEKLDYSRI